MMGMMIDANREGHEQGVWYPVLELARDGFIRAEGWEKIVLTYDDNGKVSGVGLKRESST
jgi:hypothetical protein